MAGGRRSEGSAATGLWSKFVQRSVTSGFYRITVVPHSLYISILRKQFLTLDPQSLYLQGLADAGGDGGSSSGGGGGGGNGRKENKSSHNGLTSQQPGPKRARTTTPTPAPKMPRIEPGVSPGAGVRSLLPTSPHPAPMPITRVVSPPETEEEDDDGGIVEVDPGDNPNIKSEAGWMMSGQGEDSSEYEIPSEQFEQDMQAEDEQYIQAGNDNLSGQQVGTLTQLPNTVLLLITKLGFVMEFFRHSFWQTRLLQICQIQSSYFRQTTSNAEAKLMFLICKA